MVKKKDSNEANKAIETLINENKEAPQYFNQERQENVAISDSNAFLDPNLINLIKQLNPREQQWLYGFASDFFQYKRIATKPTVSTEFKGDKLIEHIDPKLIFKPNAQPDRHNHLPLRHGRPRKRDLVYSAIKQFYNNLTIVDLRKIFPKYYEEYAKKNKITKLERKNRYIHIVLDAKTVRRLFVFSNKDFINELENIVFQMYKELYIQQSQLQGILIEFPESTARYKITKNIFYFAMKQFTNDIFLGIA